MLEIIIVAGIVSFTAFMVARSIRLTLAGKAKGNCCRCEKCALITSENTNAARNNFVSIKKSGNTGNGSLRP